MLDIKILAAVFASLAVLTAFSGGDGGLKELKVREPGFSGGLLEDVSGEIGEFLTGRASSDTGVAAEFSVGEVDTLSIASGKVSENAESFRLEGFTVKEPGNVSLNGMSGVINFNNYTVFDGTVEDVELENLKLNGSGSVEASFSDTVVFRNVSFYSNTLVNVTGKVKTGKKLTEWDVPSRVEIKNFEGRVKVLDGSRIVLRGNVSSLSSGAVRVG